MPVLGMGGFFFRAKDPDALNAWYRDNLGVGAGCSADDTGPVDEWSWTVQGGPMVFAPFKADTDYFAADKQFMLNFRVSDLDGLIDKLNGQRDRGDHQARMERPIDRAVRADPRSRRQCDRIVAAAGGMTAPTVRPARLADSERIGEIHVAAWRETYAGLMPPARLAALNVAERAAMWRHQLASGTARGIAVAEQDGAIVGFASCAKAAHARARRRRLCGRSRRDLRAARGPGPRRRAAVDAGDGAPADRRGLSQHGVVGARRECARAGVL